MYAGIDTHTGDLVAISEWVLKWRHSTRKNQPKDDSDAEDREGYLKQVSVISTIIPN